MPPAPAPVAAVPSDPVLAFVAQGQPGQVAVVQSAAYGGPVSITIGREYDSAAGDLCKNYSVVRPGGVTGEQFACGVGANWFYPPPLHALPTAAGAQ